MLQSIALRIFGMEFGGRSPGAYPSQRENCLLACAHKIWPRCPSNGNSNEGIGGLMRTEICGIAL